MKCDAGDIPSMPFKRQQRIGIRGFDIVELDRVVARGGEESLVG